MSSYIRPNIVMKTLQECYQTPLYIDANVSIEPNWQGLVEFTNASEKYTIEKTSKTFYSNNFETFQKIMEDDNTYTYN